MGSDHNAIMFTVSLNDNLTLNLQKARPSFKDANWKKYRSIINNKLMNECTDINSIHNTQQIDDKIEMLTNSILYAQNKLIPKIVLSKYGLVLYNDKAYIYTRTSVRKKYFLDS